MAFFENGKFEAIAANATANNKVNNTSDTNPFGLKDFSKLLDNKFGNSAFSSNLLEKPKGAKDNCSDNPFKADSKWTRPDINNYMYANKNNPYTIKQKPAGAAKPTTETKNEPSIFGQTSSSSSGSLFEGITINKGTGMATGGMYLAGKHKLDFCY
ncbi:MAG: hypothetical protein K6C94_05250 [Candidatus Gastranaerophilales bacterium]|nr:hypothetical protein [Candidatus Gastranaerophilales bacterium]